MVTFNQTDNIYTYWNGPIDPVTQLCLTTLKKYNPRLVIMNDKRLEQLSWGPDLLEYLEGLPNPQRSDMIRLYLIYEYGGTWVDSDTICMKKIDLEPQPLEVFRGVFDPTKPAPQHYVLANPFYAPKESPFIRECILSCRGLLNRIKAGEKIYYGATSVGLLNQLWRAHKKNYNLQRIPYWKNHRIPWHNARDVFLSGFNTHIHTIWNLNIQSYHLTNVVRNHYIERGVNTLRGVLEDTTVAAWLLGKALHIPPGIPQRTFSLYDNLLTLQQQKLRGAEIGTWKGVNAEHLLYVLPNLDLTCVDPYAVLREGSPEKLPSWGAGQNQHWWDQRYQEAAKRIEPVAHRARIIRERSEQAAKSIKDGSLDFVFIDAEHGVEGLTNDLTIWRPKIRPGGILCGHDYTAPKWPQVKSVIDQYGIDNNLALKLGSDHTWFFRLPM